MKRATQFLYTQIHKKYLAAILILASIAFLFSYVPKSYAAIASAAYVSEAIAIHKTPAWTQEQYNAEIDSIAQLSGVSRPQNQDGKWINPHVFAHYGNIIVYGLPHGEFYKTSKGKMFNTSGIQGEYQYLGYDYMGRSVTNNDYYGGTTTGIFTTYKPPEVYWKEVKYAESTWSKLDEAGYQKNYLLNTRFKDGDFKSSGSITQPPLLKDWLPDYTKKAYIQASPGLWRGASVRLEYGGTHWNTIEWNKMGCEFDGEIIPSPTSYTIKSDENEVTVSAKISANIDKADNLKHIEKIEFSFYGSSNTKTSPDTGTKYTSNTLLKSFNRSNLKTGNNQVELIGTVKVYSKYNEYKEITVKKTVSIYVEEATEPYVTATMTPEPKQLHYKGQDMPVKLTIGYSIVGITDLSKVSRITIAVPGEGTFEVARALSDEIVRNVTIPASYMNGYEKRDKIYEALVSYYLTDGTAIRGATSAAVRISTEPPEPEKPPKPDNEPPEVKLRAPTEVKAGEEFYISARGTDPDGDKLTYYWDIGEANGSTSNTGGYIWYDKIYANTVQDVYVEVSDGKDWNWDLASIYVKEPTVEAKINIKGSLKENRKVTLTDDSNCPKHYPVINRTWTIAPVTSSGTRAADIKHSGDWTSSEEDVLFKKAGEYKITLSVTNSAGYSDTTTKTITIIEDEAPIAGIAAPTTVYRSEEDTGYAAIELIDKSYSNDNDYISQRIWKYRYDSNNDGSYEDESWVTLSEDNLEEYTFKTKEVGKYQIQVNIKEGFGQNTILDYITSADYKTGSATMTVEVANLAPVVSLGLTEKKQADFIFNVWDTKYTPEQVTSIINTNLIPALNAKGIDYNILIKNNYDMSVTNKERTRRTSSLGLGGGLYDYLLLDPNYTSLEYVPTAKRLDDWYSYPVVDLPADNFRVISHNSDFSGSLTLRVVDLDGNYVDILRMLNQYHRSGDWANTSSVKINNKTYMTQINRLDQEIQLYLHELSLNNSVVTFKASAYAEGQESIDDWGKIDVVFFRDTIFTVDISSLNITKGLRFELYSTASNNSNGSKYVQTHWTVEGSYSNMRDDSIYLKDLIENTTFREGSDKYIVTISDKSLEELSDPPRKSEAVSKFMSDNINFVGFGNSSNSEQFDNFIKLNDNKGLYADNTNLAAAMNSLAEHVSETKEDYPITKYILLNEAVETNISYSDAENDPEYNRRYKYTHVDPQYFDNSLGAMESSDEYVEDPKLTFDKVGKFQIQVEARDNPKATDDNFDNYRLWSEPKSIELYVHRRPIAEPSLTYNYDGSYYVLSLTDSSYDLDHTSLENKGIVEKIWSYKDAKDPDAEWIIGKIEKAIPGKSYYIKLDVMDMEYAWDSKVILFSPPSEGVITIDPINRDWDKTGLTATITYSKPEKLSTLKYQITNSDSLPIGEWNETNLTTATVHINTEGIYYIYAQALETAGDITGAVGGPYKIDLTPPEIIANKTSGACSPRAEIELTVTDILSGFNRLRYAWSTGTTAPTTGWITSYTEATTAIQKAEGSYYLYVEAWDNVNNKSMATRFGPYTIINNRPPTVTINGTTPSFIYEGDDVIINFIATDPDLDNLTCDIEIKKGSTTVWTGTEVITPSGGSYPIVSLPTIQNIGSGSYTVSVTVKDAQDVTATATYNFNVNTLGITGSVSHTELWEQNRQKYNAAARAAGREEHSPDVFFEGERFMVHADTTTIDPQSTVTPLNVQVSIVGTSFSTYLDKTTDTKFDKGWWEERMPRWGARPLDFLFQVAYSNGTIKSDTVRIYISGDDYWRLRLLF